jgi:hypothetical protein
MTIIAVIVSLLFASFTLWMAINYQITAHTSQTTRTTVWYHLAAFVLIALSIAEIIIASKI